MFYFCLHDITRTTIELQIWIWNVNYANMDLYCINSSIIFNSSIMLPDWITLTTSYIHFIKYIKIFNILHPLHCNTVITVHYMFITSSIISRYGIYIYIWYTAYMIYAVVFTKNSSCFWMYFSMLFVSPAWRERARWKASAPWPSAWRDSAPSCAPCGPCGNTTSWPTSPSPCRLK